MPKPRNQFPHLSLIDGRGQLTLVEHSLCPLHAADSLQPNLVHQSSYYFTDKNRHKKKATATIHAPLGLSANDELYLMGLLGLALEQDEPSFDFRATPHHILRRLGCIDPHTRRGGTEYKTFRQAIQRLAHVTYECDHFYHPVRGEHVRTVFGFFKYTLPLDEKSSRAYRFLIDPLFFEICQATGGSLVCDFELCKQLSPRSRRMFMLLRKMFPRRDATPWLDLRHVCVDLMGYSPKLANKHFKARLKSCITELAKHGILAGSEFREQQVKLFKGPYFDTKQTGRQRKQVQDSPLYEPLRAIGFEEGQIKHLLKKYKTRILEEWSDITLAAIEKYGREFFTSSPQAYFTNNIQQANLGLRTAPDWWHDYRKQEQLHAESVANPSNAAEQQDPQAASAAFRHYLQTEAKEAFAEILTSTMQTYLHGGSNPQEAQKQALPHVLDHFKRKFKLFQQRAGRP